MGWERAQAWVHWRRAHRRRRDEADPQTFARYIDRVSGRHRVDVTFDDIRCARCEEIAGRLRIPRR